MPTLDGLYLFEVVMLVLGVILFFVLTGLLIFMIVKKYPTTTIGLLVLFFAFPIVLIGYPTIKKIQINKDGVDIETNNQTLQNDPTNKAARQALGTEVSQVSGRPWSDPNALTSLARAQLILGDTATAKQNVALALEKAPQLPAAVELNQRIETETQLPALTAQAEKDPNAKPQLAQAVDQLSKTGVANPNTLTDVAKAQSVLGNKESALSNLNKVLQIKPDFAPAVLLRDNLLTKSTQ